MIKAALLVVKRVRVWIVRPVGLHERPSSLLALVQTLLKLLVEMENRQAEIVPELGITAK